MRRADFTKAATGEKRQELGWPVAGRTWLRHSFRVIRSQSRLSSTSHTLILVLLKQKRRKNILNYKKILVWLSVRVYRTWF